MCYFPGIDSSAPPEKFLESLNSAPISAMIVDGLSALLDRFDPSGKGSALRPTAIGLYIYY